MRARLAVLGAAGLLLAGCSSAPTPAPLPVPTRAPDVSLVCHPVDAETLAVLASKPSADLGPIAPVRGGWFLGSSGRYVVGMEFTDGLQRSRLGVWETTYFKASGPPEPRHESDLNWKFEARSANVFARTYTGWPKAAAGIELYEVLAAEECVKSGASK